MEAESGKYLEERFPSRAASSALALARAVLFTLISSAHACPERCFVRARAESSAVLGYLLCSKGLLLLPPS